MGQPKVTPFQPGHALLCAVEIVSTDSKGNTSCKCLFCAHGGRKEVAIGRNRKRKRTLKQKLFTIPFSPHKYRSYHESQHSEAWQLYETLSDADKKEHFRSQPKMANTLHHHMGISSDTLTFSIGASIVDTIIGDMFFRANEVLDNNSDDDEPEAIAKMAAKMAKQKINAMALYVINEDDPGRYKVAIMNVLRYELAMDYVTIGMSFRQTSAAI
jgi:hypothetical protein